MTTITLPQNEKKTLLFLNDEQQEFSFLQSENTALQLVFVDLFERENVSLKRHITVEQRGENCRFELHEMGVLNGKQQLDLIANIIHKKEKCFSSQLVKYVLQDDAEFSFLGRLYIAPEAQKVEATQTNKNILLSPNARVRTQPQLEIYADDVKAAHGATTSRLESNALFYMQQRGISTQDAEKMLLYAFFDDILQKIPQDEIQNKYIEERLYQMLNAK